MNAGVRVVMTTHSEWFLEQIGNLVRASALPEDKRNGVEAINPDDVGAWLFTAGSKRKGSTVDEVTLDADTGLFPTDYDKVSESLYNEGARIFNELQGAD